MKVSYIINIVYFLQFSVTHVSILEEVHYKGWVYRDFTEVCELMHRCKILHFNSTWPKLVTKVAKTCRRQVYKILLHIYVICWFRYHSITLVYIKKTIKVIPTYFD